VGVRIGTSGWQYRDWRGRFYPSKLPQKLWLEHYVEHFETVEVNNTFYRLPPPETFAAWRRRTPAGFVMTLKASRYLTHLRQLRDPEEPVERFLAHAAPLGDRTGPILLQLPPSLRVDVPRLDHALSSFPASARVAVEVRHHSWFTDGLRDLLTRRNVPLVLTDRLGRPLEPLWRTADWGYVRLHEGTGDPWPHYTGEELAAWAERIAARWTDDEDVYVYFNNDPGCSAVYDAVDFAERVRALGRTTTRVPQTRPDLAAAEA
jgi:uncharacterized protein YecE (DUF72 family)